MSKHLVRNEEEYIAIFATNPFDVYDAEHALYIEFECEDGIYNLKSYKKYDEAIFPEDYPCVVLFDREMLFVDLIYLKDFEIPHE